MHESTLLIVDDDTAILRSFAADFREICPAVTTAVTAQEGIAALKETFFNIIVTDLVMPGTSGLHVLREAKKKDSDTCVIVLTGYGDLHSAVEALRMGADDYLLKPVDSEELLVQMMKHLSKQRQRRKLKLRENMLTVCAYCKDVRDEAASQAHRRWTDMESYLTRKSGISLSHGCCPSCFEEISRGWEDDG